MKSSKPPVSIIIPVRNGESTISQCVEALLSLDYPKRLRQIIVVDNNSTDNTPDIMQQYEGIDYVFEPTPGAYQARNTGAKFAEHDLLAFTDADCIPHSDWLSRLVQPHVSPQPPTANCQLPTDIIGGKVIAAPASNQVEKYIDHRKVLDQEKMFQSGEFSLPFFVTANCLVRRDIFEELGGFDTYYKIAGDADLCWRAQQAGFDLTYCPEAVVVHKHRSNLLGLYSQSFEYGFGRASLFKKHGRRFGARFRLDWKEHVFLLESILKSFLAPISGKPKFESLLPVFDTISFSALTLGKIYGSLKRRTLVL
ncbi:MAG: glycosyltransferase [Candidatus Coatesbacteria bacterium]|nr:glycosyltransferase [Candidatus Coatesbacteria bacterium]